METKMAWRCIKFDYNA